MKRILYLLLPVLLLAVGCKKFLDTKPTNFIQPAAFYQNKTQLMQALAGVYAPLIDDPQGSGGAIYGEFLYLTSAVVGDEWCPSGASNSSQLTDVAYGVHNYTNNKLGSFWSECYIGINRANNLLAANVDTISSGIKGADLKAMKAEAQFLRGYYYFLLVSNYGGVPLRLTPSTYPTPLNVPRASSEDTYKQVMSDMTAAQANLYAVNSASNGGSSRISQTAAWGIMARVCLFMAGAAPTGINDHAQYANAEMWAQKVINSGLHRLTVMSDTAANVKNTVGVPLAYPATLGNPAYANNGYAQLFVNAAQSVAWGGPSKESMWEMTWAYAGTSSFTLCYQGGQSGMLGLDEIVGNGARGAGYKVNQVLYDSYKPGDLRRDWNCCPYDNNNPATAVPAYRRFAYSGAPAPALQVLTRSNTKWRVEFEPLGPGRTTKYGSQTTISFGVIRYSDVLLMAAEADYAVNGGPTANSLNWINQVRRRAYGFNINTPNAISDFTTFTMADLQAERSRELCFEALRPNDLKRWGIFTSTLQNTVNYISANGWPSSGATRTNANTSNNQYLAGGPKMLLWPIPSVELNVNKSAAQNPGW